MADMLLGLSAGVLVADRYRLDRIVGMGGMGCVWAATNVTTGKHVALKFLKRPAPRQSALHGKFLTEARLTVDHPNVVQIYDVLHLNDEAPFLVMELLRGRSLREELRRAGRLPCEVALVILRQVLSAVRYAHACGVIHRDLKPENIFLSVAADGRTVVKVLDFGVARRTAPRRGRERRPADDADTVRGTLGYAAPEQASGAGADERGDVWSLGVVLYECLTGERPFKGRTWREYVEACVSGPTEDVERRISEMPGELASILPRMIAPERALRADLDAVQRAISESHAEPRGFSHDQPPLSALSDGEGTSKSTLSLESTARVSSSVPSEHLEISDEVGRALATAHTGVRARTVRAGSLALVRSASMMVGAAALFVLAWRGYPAPLVPQREGITGRAPLVSASAVAAMEAAAPAAPDGRTADPAAESAPEARPSDTSSKSSKPPVEWHRIAVFPADAQVEVNGKPARVMGGTILLEKIPGMTYAVRIWKGDDEDIHDVKADALPRELRLEPRPPPPPPGALARSPAPPAASEPVPKPVARPVSTAYRTTFE